MKKTRLCILLLTMTQILVGLASASSHPTRKDLAVAIRLRSQSAGSPFPKRNHPHVVVGSPPPQTIDRTVVFVSPLMFSAGGNPLFITSGDYNGDGIRDIAAAISDVTLSTYLSVLTGQGDGAFPQQTLTPVSVDNKSMIYSVDLNGDGKDDIVIVRAGFVDVLLSNGDATFQPPLTLGGVLDPGAVAIADVNNDGKLDLLVADQVSGIVDRFVGNGDGTFQGAIVSNVQSQFGFGVFADIDKDGKLDLVTASSVLTDDGSGSFTNATLLPGGTQNNCSPPNQSVAVGDLNNDGNPDIVVADCSTDVTVFLADGRGGFLPGSAIWAGFGTQRVQIKDVNHDALLDIVVGNLQPGDVTVLIGDGTGKFNAPDVGYALGGNMLQPFVMDDFNSDGKYEIAALTMGTGPQLTFLKSLGDGTFVTAEDHYVPAANGKLGDYGTSIASADFDGDGNPDLVLGGIFGTGQGGNVGGSETGITVFIEGMSGKLQPGRNYGTGGALASLAVGDFDGDGKLDIAGADFIDGTVSLFLGNGDGTFRDAQVFSSAPGGASAIVAADFDNDGRVDLGIIGWPNGLYVLINTGDGQFLPPTVYVLSDDAWSITAADLNDDGNLDLIIPHAVASTFTVMLGRGNGTFQILPDLINVGTNPQDIKCKDINGDNKVDMMFTSAEGIGVAFGNGDGTFRHPTFYDVSHGSSTSLTANILISDLNQDGKMDLAVTNAGLGVVHILLGYGDGTFAPALDFPIGGAPLGLLALDLNGDGALDIAATNLDYPGITTLINAGGTFTSLIVPATSATYGQRLLLTASVASSIRSVSDTPSGEISFVDNNLVVLGSASLDASGTAALNLPPLSPGEHALTAVYSGDWVFLPSTSKVVVESVQPQAATFLLTVNPSNSDIQLGNSNVFNVVLTPVNGFTGAIDFSCEQLPQGVSCNFSPSSIVLSSPQSSNVSLTVATKNIAPTNIVSHHSAFPWNRIFALGIGGFLLIGTAKDRKHFRLGQGFLVFVMCVGMAGCGVGKIPTNQPHTIVIQVRATASSVSRQCTLSILVP